MTHILIALFAPALGIGGFLALMTWALLDSSRPLIERLPVIAAMGGTSAACFFFVDIVAVLCGV